MWGSVNTGNTRVSGFWTGQSLSVFEGDAKSEKIQDVHLAIPKDNTILTNAPATMKSSHHSHEKGSGRIAIRQSFCF